MTQVIKVLILYSTVFGLTAYVYYFYHSELARVVIQYGVIAVVLFVVLLLTGSLLLGKLIGLPLRTIKKRVSNESHAPTKSLVWSRLLLGMLVGSLFLVPVIVVLLYVLSL